MQTEVIFPTSPNDPECDCPCTCPDTTAATINESSGSLELGLPLPGLGNMHSRMEQSPDPVVHVRMRLNDWFEIPQQTTEFEPSEFPANFTVQVYLGNTSTVLATANISSGAATGYRPGDRIDFFVPIPRESLDGISNLSPGLHPFRVAVTGGTPTNASPDAIPFRAVTSPISAGVTLPILTAGNTTSSYLSLNLLPLIPRVNVGFGPDMTPYGIERLVVPFPYTPPVGTTTDPLNFLIWVKPDGSIDYFFQSLQAARDPLATTYVRHATGFTLTNKHGTITEFALNGMIRWRRDRNGNQVNYNFMPFFSTERLSSIESLPNRQIVYFNRAPHLLSQFTIQQAETVQLDGANIEHPVVGLTTFEYQDGRLAQITSQPRTISGLSQTESKYQIQYAPAGSQSPFVRITDPEGRTTTIGFDWGPGHSGTVSVTYPDNSTVRVLPLIMPNVFRDYYGQGTTVHPTLMWMVPDSSQGQTTASRPLVAPDRRDGYIIDERGAMTRIWPDEYGYVNRVLDPVGNVTVIERNHVGLQLSRTDFASTSETVGPFLFRRKETFEYDNGATNLSSPKFNLTRYTSSDGANHFFTYDNKYSQLTSHTSPGDRMVWQELDDRGNPLKVVIDGNKNGGFVPTAPSANDSYTSYTYSNYGGEGRTPGGVVETAKDALGRTVAYQFEGTPWLKRVDLPSFVDATTNTTVAANDVIFTVSPIGVVQEVIDPNENKTTYQHDGFNRLYKTIYPDPDGTSGPQVSQFVEHKFNKVGLPTETIYGGLGGTTNTTIFEYHPRYWLDKVTENFVGKGISFDKYSQNITTDYDYELNGQLREIRFASDAISGNAIVENRTLYSYDAAGRLLKVAQHEGAAPAATLQSTYRYNNYGEVVELAQAGSSGPAILSHVDYDAMGRIVGVADVGGGWNHSVFNLQGELTSSYDSLLRQTTYEYDQLGRLEKLYAPSPGSVGGVELSNRPTIYAYDKNFNVTAVTDPLGQQTKFDYDTWNRLSTTTDAAGKVVKQSYDRASNLTAILDDDGNRSSWLYDMANRVVESRDPTYQAASGATPARGVTTYKYDSFGRLSEKTDRRGVRVGYTYDRLHRPDKELWLPPGTSVTPIRTIDYQYGVTGALLNTSDQTTVDSVITEGESANEYAVDFLGRVTQETLRIGSLSPVTITSAYSPDPLGRLSSNGFGFANTSYNFTNSYEYNDAGREVVLKQSIGTTNPVGITAKYSFDISGQLEKLERFGSLSTLGTPVASTVYSYDRAGRLAEMDHVKGAYSQTAELLAGYQYNYDQAHQLKSVNFANPKYAGESVGYKYDRLGQVIGSSPVKAADASGLALAMGTRLQERYSYDDNGNRTTALAVDTITDEKAFWAANEASGSQMQDSAPGSLHGVLSNVGWETQDLAPVLGNEAALKFTANSGVVTIGDHDALRLKDRNFTLSAWFKIPKVNETDIMVLISQGSPGGSPSPAGYRLMYRGDQTGRYLNFVGQATTGAYQWLSFASGMVTPDQWHHVTVVIDRTAAKVYMYLNGQLAAPAANLVIAADPNNNAPAAPFQIGWSDPSYDVHGMIDDVRVFHRALPPTELASLMQGVHGNTAANYSIGTGNRLFAAGKTEYSYDAEGNRTQQVTVSGSGATLTQNTWDHRNRLTSVVTSTPLEKAAYRFDATTQQANNSVQDRLHGTFSGTPQWETGTAAAPTGGNRSLKLTGTQSVTMSADDDLKMLDRSFSVAVWIKIDPAFQETQMTILQQGINTNGYAFYYRGEQSINYVNFQVEIPNGNYVWLQFGATAGLAAGTWHHLVATYDWTQKRASAYLNGVLEQSSIQPLYLPVGTGAAPEFRIGINSSNAAPYRGGIDDVRIYHTALTAAQVLQLKQSSELLPANTGTKRVDQYYDAFNRWVASRVDGDGNVNTPEDQQRKWFVYDGSQVAAQFEPTPTNGPAITHRYFWGLGVDELLADEKITYSGSQGTGNTAWALSDHLGTVRDLIDNSGVVRRHSSYDSFGQVQSEQFFSSSGTAIPATDPATIDTLFGYTGRAYDDATGLQNNLHRWYDAGVGRWASEDPIGFGGGDANLYRYVGNGSTAATDPSGLYERQTTRIFVGHHDNVIEAAIQASKDGGTDLNSTDAFVAGIACGNVMEGHDINTDLRKNRLSVPSALPRLPRSMWRPEGNEYGPDLRPRIALQNQVDSGNDQGQGFLRPNGVNYWPPKTPQIPPTDSALENLQQKYFIIMHEYIAEAVEQSVALMRKNGRDSWTISLEFLGDADFTCEQVITDLYGDALVEKFKSPTGFGYLAPAHGIRMDVSMTDDAFQIKVSEVKGVRGRIQPFSYPRPDYKRLFQKK